MRVSWGHFSPSPQGGTSQVTHLPGTPRLGELEHIGVLLMPRNPETVPPQPQLAGEVHP